MKTLLVIGLIAVVALTIYIVLKKEFGVTPGPKVVEVSIGVDF